MTSGLVGEMQHPVLPAVPPWVTLGLTLAAILVRTLCLDAINDTTVCARMCVCVHAHVCVCAHVCVYAHVCVFVSDTNVIPQPSLCSLPW